VTPKELAEHEGKPIALAWIDASLEALHDYLFGLRDETDESSALVASALATNFSITSRGLRLLPYLWWITAMFRSARDVVMDSGRLFFDVSEEEAKAVFGSSHALPPAYAIYDRGVYFTSAFAPYDDATGTGLGPQCRAAMVLHESIHVIDRRSGERAIHISEWDEPRFSAQTPRESLRNPSAYASFGAQVYTRSIDWPRSARFGAGRADQ
jgi:hypothetical protein